MSKNKLFFVPLALAALSLSGCISASPSTGLSINSSSEVLSSSTGTTTNTTGVSTPTNATTYSTGTYIPSSTSQDWGNTEVTSDFVILNESNEASGFTVSNSIYTITTAGTYSLTGKLEGSIIVEVADSETVELDLNGVEISSSDNAPIYAKSADKLKIKSKKKTTNVITDNRPTSLADTSGQGSGAITAKSDINLIGSGTLIVTGNCKNGVHTSKDLKIKNVQLKAYGYQHAIRGGNGIEIVNESTKVYATALTGDGLKSNDAGTSSSGKQKGTITISGGETVIHSYNDGIDAAYNVVICSGTDDDSGVTTIPTINIYTEKYATLTKAGWNDSGNTNKSSTTAKGIKASNEIYVSDGLIYCQCYDDGLHANSEALVDSDDNPTGVNGAGNVNISGGSITIACTDDGIHADNTLSITGGIINVTTSYEGLEGHDIQISGGTIKAYATNDGINAGGENNPTIVISGGYVEIEVNPNGDLDGIDSNGTFTMTGGIVISKGPNSNNASALDHEGTATINGGTLIVLGAIEGSTSYWGGGGPGGGGPGGGGSGNVTIGSNMKSYSLSLHAKGSHTINVDGTSYNFTNTYAYSRTICYSSVSVSGS